MAQKARPKIKTEVLKLKVSLQQRDEIDAARSASGHDTRTDYMIESALWGSPVYLHNIAAQIGKLGQICNEVLIQDDNRTQQNALQGEDAKRAVRKIIKTCDAVTASLRR